MTAESGIDAPKSEDQRALDELQAQKQDLMTELRLLEKHVKTTKTGEVQHCSDAART